jgi:hypothetical protein
MWIIPWKNYFFKTQNQEIRVKWAQKWEISNFILFYFLFNFNAVFLFFWQNDHLHALLMNHKKKSWYWKVYIIFCFHPILMQFFLWINCAKNFWWYVDGFLLFLRDSEINSSKKDKQKPNSKSLTFLFFVLF